MEKPIERRMNERRNQDVPQGQRTSPQFHRENDQL